jgi:photosystem II stability/assembly factor-like uncharacterized protein
MKSIVTSFIACLTLCTQGLAHWSPWTQQSTGLPTGYWVSWIYAVNDSVAWGGALTNENTPSRYYSRTTDGGASWTTNMITEAPASYSPTYVFALDASRAWTAMFNTDWGNSKPTGALYNTTDGGATWTKDDTAFSTTGGVPDFVYFFDANTGVAVGDPAASDGWKTFDIYRTSNGGAKWSRVPTANIPSSPVTEAGIIGEFSGTANSLWFPTIDKTTGVQARYLMTTDKGLTWSAHEFPSRSFPRSYTVLEFQDDSVGLGQGSQDGVMKSTDGGMTWTLIPNTSWLYLAHLEHVPGTPGMYVGISFFDAQSPEQRDVWNTVLTTDGGVNWTRIGERGADVSFGSNRAGWRTISQEPYVEKFSISPGRLIGASPDSVSFARTVTGTSADTIAVDIANYGTDRVQVTGIVPAGPNFTITQQPTFPLTLTTLQSARLTLTFTPQAGGMLEDSIIIISDASNPGGARILLSGEGFSAQATYSGFLYAASSSLFRINAKTGTTSRIDSLRSLPIHSLAVDWNEYGLYGVSAKPNASTLYRIDCATGATMLVCTFPVGNMRAIAFTPRNVLYGATMWGDFYRLNKTTGAATYIGSSSDVTFTSLAFNRSGKLLASGYLESTYDNIFAVDTATGEVALLGRIGGNPHVAAITFDPNGNLYGLTGTGADTNAIISIDTLNGVGTKLFSTGTTGLLGIAMNPVVNAVRNQPVDGVPLVFALEQNYPNPFNPRTVVNSQLPVASNVKLVIYDLLGREVAVLVNERRAPGYYQDTFDASGLASGVYIYRLTAGSFVQSRKMLLIK